MRRIAGDAKRSVVCYFSKCSVSIEKGICISNLMLMSKFKIPGVSFSLNRALGITQAKQKFARETGIPTSKAGLERKVGKIVLNAIFGKKR